MTSLKNKVQSLVRRNEPKIIQWRRYIHQNPELSFQEKKTSEFVKSILKENKITFSEGWAKYGIVATIKGSGSSKKSIALRADMDALPICEENQIEYKSKHKGLMHACGHDVHTASLLGTAIILNKLKKDFHGIVHCIFQPGEEKLPGGASILIKEGLFNSYKPKTVLAQHVHPPLDVGYVGYREGNYMASADEIYIDVRGVGGHAALPHKVVDPVLISSHLLINMQDITSRKCDPLVPSVLSFGKINSSGGATNVIPKHVKIEGTFRTMNEKWRKEVHRLIKKIAQHTAKTFGAKIKIKILKGYPCLYNDPIYTSKISDSMKNYMGKQKVIKLPKRMTAEDFSFYAQEKPSCFYRLGTGNPAKGITSSVHTPTFNIDEKALSIGSGLMAFLAIDSLSY